MHAVLPHWFDDCVTLMIRLDEAPYEWPNPPILRRDAGEPLVDDKKKLSLPHDKKQMIRMATLAMDETSLRKPEDESARTATLTAVKKNTWRGRRVLISRRLEIGDGRRSVAELSILRAGGKVVRASEQSKEGSYDEEEERLIDEVDVFVTHRRAGPAFLKVSFLLSTFGEKSIFVTYHL